MWFSIDPHSYKPVYRQIVEKVKSMVFMGKLREGEFIPSIRTLAKDLGVNVNTVARAYRELVAEGVIEPVKGEGYVVAKLNRDSFVKDKIEELLSVLKDLKDLGISKERILSLLEEVFPGEKDPRSLGP